VIKCCAFCHRHGRQGNNHLCEACKAAGKRWCADKKHVVNVSDYSVTAKRCYACHAERHKRDRGTIPPAGYTSARALARQLGYHHAYLLRCIKDGWMRGKTWQRCAGGTWYVLEQTSYPPLTTRERIAA